MAPLLSTADYFSITDLLPNVVPLLLDVMPRPSGPGPLINLRAGHNSTGDGSGGSTGGVLSSGGGQRLQSSHEDSLY